MIEIPSVVTNTIMAGSLGTFLVSVLLATVVFDKPDPNSSLPSMDLEMGIAFAVTEQHIETYMDAILNTHTIIDILTVSKTDENFENPEEGSIADLFPIGTPAYGKGSVQLKVRSIPSKDMPDLTKNRKRPTQILAYLKEDTFSEIKKSALKGMVLLFRFIVPLVWLGVLWSLTCIGLGVLVLLFDKANSSVEPMDEDDEEEEEEEDDMKK